MEVLAEAGCGSDGATIPRDDASRDDAFRDDASRDDASAPASDPVPTAFPRPRSPTAPTAPTAPAAPAAAAALVAWGSPGRLQRQLLAEDDREQLCGRRERLYAREQAALTARRPLGGECPFHHQEDVLAAVVEAVQNVTDVAAPPEMNLSTNPRYAFSWAVNALMHYGDECRAEGRAEATRTASHPLPPEVGGRLLDTCTQMWSALKATQRQE